MTKVLWLAPNFNHYKARFLNHFAMEDSIALDILSGTGRSGLGDKELTKDWAFNHHQLPVSKKKFGFSAQVRSALKSKFKQYDWILIPAEKKNIFLFLYALILRRKAIKKGVSVQLFSYNHPVLQSGNGKITKLDIWLTKFYYKHLDRIIFYTEDSCKWAIAEKLIDKEKAYWANNTIDTIEINKHYSFNLPHLDEINILFIGRLIPSKKIGIALKYFELIQKQLKSKKINFHIIGDGPDSHLVKKAIQNNSNIFWHGALVEESEIAPIMKQSTFVFLPGDSGLSIYHAFAYGRSYVTFESKNHGPEISYISEQKNGLILKNNDVETNIKKIISLMSNEPKLHDFCLCAKQKGEELSVQNWVGKIKQALLDD